MRGMVLQRGTRVVNCGAGAGCRMLPSVPAPPGIRDEAYKRLEAGHRSLESESMSVQRPEDRRTVRNIVQMGFWAPSMAFLRRCREAGIATHLIPMHEEGTQPSAAKKPSAAIIFMSESLPLGLDKPAESLEQAVAFVRAVRAEAISSDDEGTLGWLARHRERFEPECLVMASPAAAIERMMQKSEQSAMAREAGFRVLPTWLIEPGDQGAAIDGDGFPLCVRPTRMNSVEPEFKAERVADRGALERFLRGLRWTSALIAQPFRTGPNRVLHGVRSEDGRMLALECFRTVSKHHGFALTIERCDLPEELRLAAERFAALADLRGAFHFDLLEDGETGEIFFLEVNYRMGGTTAKVVRLGYDEPMLALRAFGLEPPWQPRALVAARRTTGKRMLTGRLIESLRQPAGALDYPASSRWSRFWDSTAQLAAVPDALLSWRDVRGSLWYLLRGGRM